MSQAFPKIFSRSTPMMEGNARLLEAARILTALQVSAVMVLDKSAIQIADQYRALTGYSILSKLPLKDGEISKFFAKPSMELTRKIKVVKEGAPIESVVKAIQESRVGVVLVARSDGSSQVLNTIELRDFVRLYREGSSIPETNLRIGNLTSSPVLSLKNDTTLRDLIESMLKYRVRRMLLSERRTVVSDRDVLSYILSPGTVERMDISIDEVLKTPANQLPSTRPPVVDSRITVTEAAQLMNPDSGDCLICERGLVTFWDIVVKLEQLKKSSSLMPRDQGDSIFSNEIPAPRTMRSSISNQVVGVSKNEMSLTSRKAFAALSRKIQSQGFVTVDEVPRFARRKVVDPLYLNQPVRPFHLMGVCSGRKGAIRFSAVNLFGLRMLDESYYVLDWERFSKFISQRLEMMFRSANPNPSRGMKVAFTRFLHNFGLHWTGCNHRLKSNRNMILNTTT